MSSGGTRGDVPVTVPDVGAAADELQFAQWLVDEGSTVNAGDRIAELMLPGVLISLAAPIDGVLARIAVAGRTRVTAGQVLAWIDPHGS